MIEVIIENTIQSCLDQWVLSIAMFVKTFWLTQSLDTQNEYELDSFQEALKDLKQIRNYISNFNALINSC